MNARVRGLGKTVREYDLDCRACPKCAMLPGLNDAVVFAEVR